MYTISKECSFIIYGASFVGRNILDILKKYGWNVKYYLDRGTNITSEVKGIKVYNPDQEGLEIDSEKDIVFIAVTEAAEHTQIANFLLKKGYTKIILKSGTDEDEINPMDIVYNSLLEGKSIENMKVPYYQKKEFDIEYLEHMYYEKKGENYIIDVPLELLFYEEGEKLRSVYQNQPLLTYYNYLEGRENIDSLKELEKKCILDLPRWMEKEKIVYRHMAEQWQYGKLKKMPYVVREKEGRFIVKTALKEVIFSVAKGYKRVACELSVSDYNKWLMKDEVKACIDIIQKYNISFVYTPILHPFFYDFPCKREELGYTRLMGICRYLSQVGIELQEKKVLDVGTYIGYFAQHFARMGAETVGVEYDFCNYELAILLKKLSSCNRLTLRNIGVQDIGDEEEFDIVFMLSVLNWHMYTELGEQIVKKIDQVAKQYLIWESGDEIETEKDFIFQHSSFTKYEKIMETFGTGKIRELGIFCRE